jgi:hypothetical protein
LFLCTFAFDYLRLALAGRAGARRAYAAASPAVGFSAARYALSAPFALLYGASLAPRSPANAMSSTA